MLIIKHNKNKSLIENLADNAGILGWRVVGVSFPTDYGTLIDMLAFDEDNIPVVVQVKRHPADNIALEALSYYNNITGHKSGQGDLLAQSKYPDVGRLLWERARLLLLAPSFNHYDLDMIGSFPVATDAYRYHAGGEQLIITPQFVPGAQYTEEEGEAYNVLANHSDSSVRQILEKTEQFFGDIDACIRRVTTENKVRYYLVNDICSLVIADGGVTLRINGNEYSLTEGNVRKTLENNIGYGT